MTQLIVFLLPVTAAFGSLLPGVSSLFVYRLLVLVLALLALFDAGRRNGDRVPSAVRNSFGLMAAVWVFVGLAGSIFVADSTPGVRELLAIVLGFVLTYSLLALRRPETILVRLERGWTFAYFITALVAIREILTGKHLSNYLTTTDLAAVDTRLTASVFGNPNAYATFLIITFPILVRALEGSQRRAQQWAMAVGVVALPGLVLASGSRLGLMAVLLETLLLSVFATRRFRRILIGGAIAIGLGLVAVGSGAADQMTSMLPGKLATAAPSQLLKEAGGGAATSGGQRLNLYRDGLWMMVDTAGLGKGPGQFPVVMAKGEAPYDAAGVTDPHNTYFEIGAEYGLIVLVLFLVWSARCAVIFFHAAKECQGDQRSWAVSMLVSMAGLVIGALANSTALVSSVNWTFCATIMVAATHLEPFTRRANAKSLQAGPARARERSRTS